MNSFMKFLAEFRANNKEFCKNKPQQVITKHVAKLYHAKKNGSKTNA